MSEDLGTQAPEEIDEDFVMQILLKDLPCEKPHRRLFGEQNFQRFHEIVRSPDLVDLDLLFSTGQISFEELLEYATLLPGIHEIEIRFGL